MGKNNAGIVIFELGGRELKLQFDMYALFQLQALTGKNLLSNSEDVTSPQMIVGLLWAGCLRHQPEFDGYIGSNGPDKKVKDVIRKLGAEIGLDSERLNGTAAAISEAFAKAKGTGDLGDKPEAEAKNE